MRCHLHFSFGPVQAFIAQARRTRDLYVGSFLLSHLALKAMEAAASAGGRLVLPDLARIRSAAAQSGLAHAVAPNRFLAEFSDEAVAAQAGQAAAQALKNEWRSIADVVWTQCLEPGAALGRNSRAIWERQIDSFWEIFWVVGPPAEHDLLDRRRQWRTLPPTSEPGDHCTLMGQWQELSGWIRATERKAQDEFWHAVRTRLHSLQASVFDLEEDERLCAIAFVKRFLPLVSRQALGRDLSVEHWPSTVTIAAVPWLRKLKSAPGPLLEQCAEYARYVRSVSSERAVLAGASGRIALLRDFPRAAGDFPKLSGNFLNRSALLNERSTRLQSEASRPELAEKLRRLEQASQDRAGNFYAVLVMDGDSMGRLLRQESPERLTAGLSAFATKAPALLEQETLSGVCVYSGGDDLLALLPVDSALDAAVAVRRLYQTTLQEQARVPSATISAGLALAHYRCALSRVLRYARYLLDQVAKDRIGRDAIAIGVLKPGGIACEWAQKFDAFIRDDTHAFAPLVEAFRRGLRGEAEGISASFLYNLQQRFSQLARSPATTQDFNGRFDPSVLEHLFLAEYLHGRLDPDPARADEQRRSARRLIQQLVHLCCCTDPDMPDQPRIDLSALRLLKFLALEGKEGAE
ncbi:type III-B CRISPR-associated protein Cas10/Cmr2 [Limisphaera sp. VF-2]|jgi:CRISPR-associated protein Cmr2|uniref:type III-B CRISPR-associated protein Cas10/Cmr2 n=1 Tax=Limisphaera sp. VF-2 TaxID=3400418 RepID=UPI001779D001